MEQQEHQKKRYSREFNFLGPKDKGIVYILWQIHNRKLSVGSMIYYEAIEKKFNISKTSKNLMREFLSGANIVVNDVVIKDKVPKELLERFNILDE